MKYTFKTEVACTLYHEAELDVGDGSEAEIDAAQARYHELIKADDLPMKVNYQDGSHYDAVIKADGTIVRAKHARY